MGPSVCVYLWRVFYCCRGEDYYRWGTTKKGIDVSTKSNTAVLSTLLEQNRTAIIEEWKRTVMDSLGHKYPGVLSMDELHRHADMKLSAFSAYFSTCGEALVTVTKESTLGRMVYELSTDHDMRGIKPVDTALYLVALKKAISHRLALLLPNSQEQLVDLLEPLFGLMDQLTLLSFDAYSTTREKVIAQQSQSLMELSTPVIVLWNNVLLLPLVGVIDTIRARQFTERMLEAITRHEGIVTIIDVTGVPVFDTGVARHIMKAVDAAQLLGSKVVMTGISPEGAQTLTKLGISFANVTSRVSLRAGVAEALKLVGRRIELINGAN